MFYLHHSNFKINSWNKNLYLETMSLVLRTETYNLALYSSRVVD